MMGAEINFPFEKIRNTLGKGVQNLVEFRVTGANNLPKRESGGAIIAIAPHTGHLDSIAVRTAFPLELRDILIFLAAADYWVGWKKLFSQLLVASFALTRNASRTDMQRNLAGVTELLKSGKLVGIFPEGSRGNPAIPTESRPYQNGLAGVVKVTNGEYPVIPAKITGLETVMPKGKAIPSTRLNGKKRKVGVIFGDPIKFASIPGSISGLSSSKITAKVREAIESLS